MKAQFKKLSPKSASFYSVSVFLHSRNTDTAFGLVLLLSISSHEELFIVIVEKSKLYTGLLGFDSRLFVLICFSNTIYKVA